MYCRQLFVLLSMTICCLARSHQNSSLQLGIPCREDGGPEGCEDGRVTECGQHEGFPVLGEDQNFHCLLQQSIRIGQTYIVRWTNSAGSCLEMVATVGDCWGLDELTGGVYDCQGRCGPACNGAPCNDWARDCFRNRRSH